MAVLARLAARCRVGLKQRWGKARLAWPRESLRLVLVVRGPGKIAYRRKNDDGLRGSKGINTRGGTVGEEKVRSVYSGHAHSGNPRWSISWLRYISSHRRYFARAP